MLGDVYGIRITASKNVVHPRSASLNLPCPQRILHKIEICL